MTSEGQRQPIWRYSVGSWWCIAHDVAACPSCRKDYGRPPKGERQEGDTAAATKQARPSRTAEESQRRRNVAALIVVGVIIAWFLFGWILSIVDPVEEEAGDESTATTTTSTHSEIDSASAVEQMAVAFIGNYSESEIRTEINSALNFYEGTTSEDLRSRGGSVLVELRKEYGIAEMEILEYMNCSQGSGTGGFDFAEMAALAVTALDAGDLCVQGLSS